MVKNSRFRPGDQPGGKQTGKRRLLHFWEG